MKPRKDCQQFFWLDFVFLRDAVMLSTQRDDVLDDVVAT